MWNEMDLIVGCCYFRFDDNGFGCFFSSTSPSSVQNENRRYNLQELEREFLCNLLSIAQRLLGK